MFFYMVLTPISTTSGLWSTGNTRKYHQIDVYIYQCEYAQSMWSDSYSANIDILGQLHDIHRLFNICLKKYFNPNWKKMQSLFTYLRLPMPNRTWLQLFLLLNWQLRIWLFGRLAKSIFRKELYIVLKL